MSVSIASQYTFPDSAVDQHQPGVKNDHGKNKLGLIFNGFANALWAVGQVGTFGAVKYTEDSWCSVLNAEKRYTDALYRHLLLEAQGEKFDDESGLLHAAHTAWNALARLELQIRKISQTES